jgi:hypothetical protein
MSAPETAAAPAPDLDRWLAAPTITTRHRRAAPVDPERLWRAASQVRLDQTRTLGRLVQWRIPGTPAHQTFRELFSRPPFVVLDEGAGYSISGLCGRIWTLRRDYPHLRGAADFDAWDEPGTARVLFAHWVRPAPDGGGASLQSEARVAPVDARARLALALLWRTVGVFERRIGAEALSLAVHDAVRSADYCRTSSGP